MSTLALLALLPFPALVIIAALRDATSMTIPNWISVALAGAFAIAALFVRLPLPFLGTAALAGVVMLAAGVAMFALRWLGGGDAKLLAACALWLGWSGLTPLIIYTGLAGGVLVLTLLAGRRAAEAYALRGPAWVDRLLTPGGDVPYGIAIAAGALAAFPESPLMAAFLRVNGS